MSRTVSFDCPWCRCRHVGAEVHGLSFRCEATGRTVWFYPRYRVSEFPVGRMKRYEVRGRTDEPTRMYSFNKWARVKLWPWEADGKVKFFGDAHDVGFPVCFVSSSVLDRIRAVTGKGALVTGEITRLTTSPDRKTGFVYFVVELPEPLPVEGGKELPLDSGAGPDFREVAPWDPWDTFIPCLMLVAIGLMAVALLLKAAKVF